MTEFSSTDAQFQNEIWKDEPDYHFLASFGDDIMTALEELLEGDNEMLAQRAVHIAGLLDRGAGLPLLMDASQDPRETVRVAVAGAIRSQSIQAMQEAGDAPAERALAAIVNRLLTDEDSSVRRWAAKSAGMLGLVSVKAELERLAREDAEVFVRSAATQALKHVAR